MNKRSESTKDYPESQASRENICTCKECKHSLSRDCMKTQCICCKEGSHSMILDGIEGFGVIRKGTSRYTKEHEVQVSAGPVTLEGALGIPEGAKAIVLFAHGSGSSRHSPRNQYVAKVLRKAGLATLLIDLLTAEEETIDFQTAHLRFDISLLAKRLVGVTDWLIRNPDTRNLNIGYFGASTGAGAALVAAAERSKIIGAVVSRGGRPDLAGSWALQKVQAPTLLIVGGYDYPVIEMNQEALNHLRVEKKLVIVPCATHLFEEPGKLEEAAQLATHWFVHYLLMKDTANNISKSRKVSTIEVR